MLAGDQGLPFNPGAAFALVRHAASLGDAEAQTNLGLFQAAGIHAPASNVTHKCEALITAFRLGQYFFAIFGEPVELMAILDSTNPSAKVVTMPQRRRDRKEGCAHRKH